MIIQTLGSDINRQHELRREGETNMKSIKCRSLCRPTHWLTPKQVMRREYHRLMTGLALDAVYQHWGEAPGAKYALGSGGRT
jgi:hypothetical protein